MTFNHFILFKHKPSLLEETRAEAPVQQSAQTTRDRMLAKLNELEKKLESVRDLSEALMIVGSEDFFESARGGGERGACFDMDTAYGVIANELKELSKRYPNVLICPGSFYISAPIPPEHQANRLLQNDEQYPSLKKVTCYVSNIMPIYFNGELLRIIRKGEKLCQKNVPPGKNKKTILNAISSVDEFHDGKGRNLVVTSYHEDELESVIKDESKGLHGVCYLGKTYLPGEVLLIKKILGEKVDVEALMHPEFELGENKYLALVCGEYIGEQSTTRQLLEENHYDYIIHSTNGGNLDHLFNKQHGVYVHSDQGSMSKVLMRDTQNPEKTTECQAVRLMQF